MKQLTLFGIEWGSPPAKAPEPAPIQKAAPAQGTSLAPLPSHPQANRRIALAGQTIAYHLRRGRRKTIGFVVGSEGLVVSAPRWVLVSDIERAVHEKSLWILARLHEARERVRRDQALRVHWGDGVHLPYLGETVIVVLDPREAPASARLVRREASASGDALRLPGVPDATLHVGLPQEASPDRIRDCVQAWLMNEARRCFTARLDHFAPLLGVRWARLALSNANTRWGTASANGHIRLNWRLIHFKLSVIDYVVAHELAHLQVMDHSPRFWDTVARVVPDYSQRRAALRDGLVPRWD